MTETYYAGIGYTGDMGFQEGNDNWSAVDFDVRSENRYVLHPQGLRRCLRCREVKLIDDFAIKGKNGQKNSSCKMCENVRLSEIRSLIKQDPQRYCKSLVAQLRHRSAAQSVPFDLDGAQLYWQWTVQDGCCYYTGDKLYLSSRDGRGGRPHLAFPSVDRLNPEAGYVKENVVWCRWDVNRAKSNLTRDEFISLCSRIAERF